ncbi:hypothetical protein LPW11_16490 [Geomonas sp. RF6]|uniref:hypothetical protein n=1 Tax=Geomonas sp. RF6 TaxID=2897342 RepID=UPI001E5D8224|nr:hypothetical protein [Geomonas sp. RF6]UFS69486.1 hypothetical protein LPW11_16490 [Geomonas sp. RF6]
MPKMSLTDFVEIVSKAGTEKAAKIAKVKHRTGYNPATDFYKKMRERLISIHQGDHDREYLLDLGYVSDTKKLKHFGSVAHGYVKWWGKKQIAWFPPPNYPYVYNSFQIGVNPELGLAFDNKKYVIKLYLKCDEIPKSRIDVVLHLMERSLRPYCSEDTVMAILDVRNSKLITESGSSKYVDAMISAELAFIEAIWPNV